MKYRIPLKKKQKTLTTNVIVPCGINPVLMNPVEIRRLALLQLNLKLALLVTDVASVCQTHQEEENVCHHEWVLVLFTQTVAVESSLFRMFTFFAC